MRATSGTNRSAKGGARSSPHYGGEGVLIHPPHQGVCGRHGTEDQGVTPGELPGSSGGTEGSDSISASETRSSALEVVGRLGSTGGAAKVAPPEAWRPSGSGKQADEDGRGETGSEMSKAGEEESSLSERPGHHRPRRLADWINPTGARKVHSLIDKVYKRKNLEIAWERVRANHGAGGIDGESIEAFGEGLEERLARLHEELRTDSYAPQPVRQVRIPPTERGTPQGGVASPLLSNILLTPFDREMRSKG